MKIAENVQGHMAVCGNCYVGRGKKEGGSRTRIHANSQQRESGVGEREKEKNANDTPPPADFAHKKCISTSSTRAKLSMKGIFRDINTSESGSCSFLGLT